MAQKPGIPKGTRDFSPLEVAKRQYIISIIKKHFECYGFQPIETPSFENLETLMGKYGEEGDRLIFKILNSGDYFETIKNLMSSYLGGVFKYVVDQISFRLNSEKKYEAINEIKNGLGLKEDITDQMLYKAYEDAINDAFTEQHIQSIIDQINSNNTFQFKLNNFYTDEFKEIIFQEIKNIRRNGLLNSSIIDSLEDCISCDVNSDSNVKYFIDRRINVVIGQYFQLIESKKLTPQISEKALRYDLTVPFARYVVQHQNELEFPFKRYQIQPVWRADRPQKGRFREFFQCDADVVGSKSLWQEVEFVQLYDAVFTDLKVEGVTIKINNRKILSGIAEVIGASDKLIDFTVALDKLDKIGEEGVKTEMLEKGISQEAIEKVQPLFNFSGTLQQKIEQLRDLLKTSEEGSKGVDELSFICESVQDLGLKSTSLNLDVTLARGLNYYTGAIFEVAAPETVKLGSIGGGGRYDDLTGVFGLKNMSGVGISFGLDRIYLTMEELNVFPETVSNVSDVLFLNYGNDEAKYALKAIQKLREAGIKAELYPDKAKMDKQFKYAEKKGILKVVMAGSNEIEASLYTLKDLQTGVQQTYNLEELIAQI